MFRYVLIVAFAVYMLGVPYLDRRRGIRFNWSFLKDRRAMTIGGAVTLVLQVLNASSVSSFAWGLPTSLLVGGIVAQFVHWRATKSAS